jgi:hypothetical protein
VLVRRIREDEMKGARSRVHEVMTVYKIFVGVSERKRPICKWVSNIRTKFKEVV